MKYIEIDNRGSIYFLLNAFIGAYNRRTDVMEASTDVAIQRRIDELTNDLKSSTTTVQEAVADDTKGK